jgi:hypothetical protein
VGTKVILNPSNTLRNTVLGWLKQKRLVSWNNHRLKCEHIRVFAIDRYFDPMQIRATESFNSREIIDQMRLIHQGFIDLVKCVVTIRRTPKPLANGYN